MHPEAALPPIRVRLVIDRHNRPWIIGKFADRLAENLSHWNVTAEISDAPSPDVDVNHWMIYHYPWTFYYPRAGERPTKATMLITHVDDPIKLRMVKWALDEVVDVGVCLSRMTLEQLVQDGVKREQLSFATPAHDFTVTPRRIVIGITTRVYPDRRKREHVIAELAEKRRLDAFHFDIQGRGWEEVISRLEAAGATVAYQPETDDFVADYALLRERIPHFDFYLYTGRDDGSMGTIDALAAGVGTIVVPDGFHLDIPGGITHAFWNSDDLCEVFDTIARDRQRRVDGVAHLTWREYARKHAHMWEALLGRPHGATATSIDPTLEPFVMPSRGLADDVAQRVRFYHNARKSDYLRPISDHWRRRARTELSKMKWRVLGLLGKTR